MQPHVPTAYSRRCDGVITTVAIPKRDPQEIIETITDILIEYGEWCIKNNRKRLHKTSRPDLQAQPSR